MLEQNLQPGARVIRYTLGRRVCKKGEGGSNREEKGLISRGRGKGKGRGRVKSF